MENLMNRDLKYKLNFSFHIVGTTTYVVLFVYLDIIIKLRLMFLFEKMQRPFLNLFVVTITEIKSQSINSSIDQSSKSINVLLLLLFISSKSEILNKIDYKKCCFNLSCFFFSLFFRSFLFLLVYFAKDGSTFFLIVLFLLFFILNN